MVTNADIDVREGKHLFIASENATCYKYYENEQGVSSKNLKIYLPPGPPMQILDI